MLTTALSFGMSSYIALRTNVFSGYETFNHNQTLLRDDIDAQRTREAR